MCTNELKVGDNVVNGKGTRGVVVCILPKRTPDGCAIVIQNDDGYLFHRKIDGSTPYGGDYFSYKKVPKKFKLYCYTTKTTRGSLLIFSHNTINNRDNAVASEKRCGNVILETFEHEVEVDE